MAKEVYKDETTTIVELLTFQDAEKLPVNKVWCICQGKHNFDRYINLGCRLFFIDNNDESIIRRYVALVLYKDGKKVFWDMTDEKIQPQYLNLYFSTLSVGAKKFILGMPTTLEESLDHLINKIILEYINPIAYQKRLINESEKKSLYWRIFRSAIKGPDRDGWNVLYYKDFHLSKKELLGLYKSYKRFAKREIRKGEHSSTQRTRRTFRAKLR